MNIRVKSIVVALLLFSSFLSFAINRDHLRELNKQAAVFGQQKDWKSLREVLIKIGDELGTPTPYQMLRMASVEERLGNNKAALQWMARYAATGLTYDVASDDDLKPLLTEAGYASIAQVMKQNSEPVTKAEVVCSLPVADLMPEDLTYDGASHTFIVSSVQHHTLYRISLPKSSGKECDVQELSLDDDVKRWPTFAVSLDGAHHVLWATAAGFAGAPKEDEGKAALFALDSSTGKTLRRFDLQGSSPAVLGDMTVAPDGTVYVTDSLGGGVYRVHGAVQTAQLEKIADGLFSPQTPVLAKDGKRLFVADYSVGIAVVDLASGKVDYLPHPENIAVTGLDGLHAAGGSFVGVQNGTEPERIVRLQLNPAQTEITSVEVLEQGLRIGDPTHAIEVDGMTYVSANVGWNKVDDHGALKTGEHFTAPLLLRFAVK
jgi:sugar lactone lactonase YvrE